MTIILNTPAIRMGSASSPSSASPKQHRLFFASQTSTPKDLTNTTHERWKHTEKEALELFKQNPEPEQLIKATQALFTNPEAQTHGIRGVEVFDGAKPGMEWVNDICLHNGSIFVYVPPSLQWKDVATDIKEGNVSVKDVQLKSEYEKKLNEDKKLGVFLCPNYTKRSWPLQHEILHVLQNKNGLYSGSRERHIDEIAMDFIQQFSKFPVKNVYVQNIWRLFRIADSYTFEIPLAFAWGTITGRAVKAYKNRNLETPGKAVRRYADREMEVDKFFIVNGGKIGASFATRLEHVSHFFCESLLQYLRSFKLDFAKNQSMPA